MVGQNLVISAVLFCLLVTDRSAAGETQPSSRPAVSPSFQSYVAHIAAARSAFLLDEPSAARQWLAAAPEEHRDFEWLFLCGMQDQSQRQLANANGSVWQVAISQRGVIAVATSDHVIELLDQTGAVVRRLEGCTAQPYRVAISPDGSRVAAGGADRVVRIWNAATGELLRLWQPLNTPITCLTFSNDGGLLFAGNYTAGEVPPQVDGTVKWLNVATGDEAGEIKGIGVKPLSGVSLSPDGKRFVAGSWNGELWICNVEQIKVESTIKLPDEGAYNAVNAVAWSADGKWIICGSKDNAARVFDAASGELKFTLRHSGWVTAVAFTPDSTRVLTACSDEQLRLWDVKTGAVIAKLRGHRGGVTALAVSTDGTRAITGGQDARLLAFDLERPAAEVLTWDGPPGCYGLSFAADAKTLLVNGFDGTLRRYDAWSGSLLQQVQAHEKSSNWSAASRDGASIVTCSWDKTIRIFDGGRLDQRLAIDVGETPAYGCAISPDGKLVAGAFGDKTARIYHAETGTLLWRLEGHEKGLHEVSFSPDSTLLATAAMDGTARIWSVDAGTCVATLSVHRGAVEGVAFSPDGSKLATVGTDGIASVCSVATGDVIWKQQVSTRGLQRVTWSPNGRRLAIAGDALYLVDSTTGVTALRYVPRAGDVYNLQFNGDGTRLAMCAADGWIAIISTEGAK